MVFLGGAVLANIVSTSTSGQRSTPGDVLTISTDGRQRKHVDLEARMARARPKNIREAGR